MFWNKHVWVNPITGERITSENVWEHRLSRKELLAQIAWADETNRALQNKVAKAEEDNRRLCAVITRRDERIKDKELEDSLRKAPDCGTCPDAQRSYQESESWKKRAEAAEKRLHEPLPVVKHTIWRVRAKAAELAALRAVPQGTDPTVRAVEFWRAVRKLGVPVDQVKDVRQHLDYFEFYDFGELSISSPVGAFITTVFEIG